MQPHEKDTILRLRKLNFDAKPVLPTGTSRTPDVFIGNQLWEIKSPVGFSKKTTIYSQLKRAKKQSEYLVIDTKRTKLPDDFIAIELRKLIKFKAFKKIKHILLIKKSGKTLDIER